MTEQIGGQMTIFDFLDRDIWCGKTFQEPSVPTKEKIFAVSSKKRQGLQTKMPQFLDLRGGSGVKQDAYWEMDGASLGDCMMHNFGEFHKDEREYVYLLTSTDIPQQKYYLNCSEKPMKEVKSKLSWVLEKHPNPKYNLSEKACRGILSRAERRGKELPTLLKETLLKQSAFKNVPDVRGGVKASLSNEREQEHCQPSITNPSCQSNESSQDCICFEPGAATRVGGHIYTDDIAGTIRANAGDNQQAVSIGNGQLNQISMDETANCLDTMHDQQAVITYGLDRASFNQGKNAQFDFSVEEDLIGSQVAKGPGAVASFYPQMKAESQCFRHDDISVTLVNGTNPGFQNGIVDSVVRRLTPMECERLQGYPDKWTDIGEWFDSTGKKHRDADTPRYKALGNSIALPFWGWLAERIVAQYDRKTTMASLFDGIGGFPLVFSRCGCEPIWASEIEEFPIAVTKLRFPDKEDSDAN